MNGVIPCTILKPTPGPVTTLEAVINTKIWTIDMNQLNLIFLELHRQSTLSKFQSDRLRASKSISQTFHPSLTNLPLRICAALMVKSSLCESLRTIMETRSD